MLDSCDMLCYEVHILEERDYGLSKYHHRKNDGISRLTINTKEYNIKIRNHMS